MAVNIGPQIGLNGEAAYTKSLKNIIAQSKALQAEMKAVTSAFDANDSSQKKLESQINVLNKQIETQQQRVKLLGDNYAASAKKVDDLNAELVKVIQEFGKSSTQAQKAAQALDRQEQATQRARTEYLNATTALNRMQSQMGELSGKVNQVRTPLENLTDTIESQQRELDDLKNQYANAVLEFGKGSNSAQRLAREIDSLSGDLKKNQKRADDAAYQIDDLGDSFDDAGDKAASFGDIIGGTFLGNVLSDLASNAAQAIGELAGEALDASDSLLKFESTMDFAGFDSKAIKETEAAMQDYAARTVYDLETVSNTVAQLGANGVDNFEALTEAAGNLNAVAGGNADTFQSVAQVLTQTAGAGKLTTENWNQLTDAIPGASGVLQQAMLDAGAYTGNFREAMEEGEISAEEFNTAIMELGNSDAAKQAATSVDTVESSIGNLKSTIKGIITSLLNSGGSDIITSTVDGISGAIKAAADFVTNHGDEITGFLTNAKTTLQEIGTQISPYIKSVFDYIGGRVKSEIELWNQVSSKFEEYKTKLQTAWSEIQPYVQPIIEFYDNLNSAEMDAIKNVVQFFSDLSKAGWESMEDIAQWYQSVIQWSTETSIGIVNGFNDAVNFFKNLPSSAYKWASDMISKFANGISAGIGQVRSAVSSVADLVTSWLHFSRPDVGPLREYESWMPDMMAGMARGIRQNAWKLEDALYAATSYMQPNINVSGSAIVGEAGPELMTVLGNRTIVQPLPSRYATTPGGQAAGAAVAPQITINVYGAEGQDVNQLADVIMQKIESATNQREAVF